MYTRPEYDSDEDEGFLPTKIQIKKQEKTIKEIITRPIDFEPRYICGAVSLKKQPQEVYERFEHYLPTALTDKQKPFVQEKQSSLRYQQYFTSPAYRLVYSRFSSKQNSNAKDHKKKSERMNLFTNNQIKLSNVLNQYKPDQFSVLKKNQQDFMASQANQAINNLLKSVSLTNVKNQEPQNNSDLVFDSKFQGGNLMHAFRYLNSPNTYALFMQNDSNTIGYNQWFYFTIKNAQPDVSYRFHILNFRKRNLLFKQGLKISVFSLVDAINNKKKSTGWTKMGQNIKYQRSPMRLDNNQQTMTKNIKYYSLSFSMKFKHANDYISIAMNPPYTYSRLIYNINQCKKLLQNNQQISWKMKPIAHSLANNAVPYITLQQKQGQPLDIVSKQQPKYLPELHSIQLNRSLEKIKNNYNQTYQKQQKEDEQMRVPSKKKMIIFLARQHPGQTWSSFLMQEIMYYLATHSKDKCMKDFYKNYIIKIFPMINVDGVIYGNFRCDLGGFDLNRTWKEPHRDLHPQIYAIKREIQKLNQNYVIQSVFDLHGHSKQFNVFCYSCQINPVTARILPKMIHNSNKLFHFPSCTFGLSRYKQSTARAVIHKIINNQNVLTIQNSFYGMNINGEMKEFEPVMHKNMAQSIIISLLKYLQMEQERKSVQVDMKKNIRQYVRLQEKQGVDSGSDSDPYQDEIPIKQKIIHVLPKGLNIDKFTKDEIPKKQRKIPVKKPPRKKEAISQKKSQSQLKIPKIQGKFFDEQVVTSKKLIQVGNKSMIKTKKNSLSVIKALGNQLSKYDKMYQPAKRIDLSTKAFATAREQSQERRVSHHFSVISDEKPKIIPINARKDSLQLFKNAYSANTKKTETYEQQIQRNYKKGIINSWNRSRQTETFPATSNSHDSIKQKSIIESNNREQLPILCIFSDKKRQQAEQKKRQRQRTQKNLSIKFKEYERTNKIQRGRQLDKEKRRQKQWGNTNRGWKQLYSHLGLNVFFGDMK